MSARHLPRRRVAAAAGALALVLSLAACGSDGDDDAGTTTAPPASTGEPTTTHDEHTDPTITVGAVDFAFQDLPRTIEAGTRIELVNKAEAELHELVAFRLPDTEERSIPELLELAPADFEAAVGGPPALVILAPPGDDPAVTAVGDGTLAEPGRYLVLCSIPTGADPAEYLAAAAANPGEQPQVEGGPPHMAQGMVAEVIVE